jgi:crotonobetaine/carnitine-CoA ligase
VDITNIPLARRNIRAVLEIALDQGADRLALRDPQTQLTYEQAWAAALVLGGGLEQLGVERQEAVLLMLDNHADNALCWMALALTGRVEVSINTAYKGDMLTHIINDSGAKTILIEERHLQKLLDVSRELKGIRSVVLRRASETAMAAAESVFPSDWRLHDFGALRSCAQTVPDDLNPWDLISISYTSGTTGRSKGVLCPHAHAFGHASPDGLSLTRPGETRFIVLPQFHIAGRWGGVYNAFLQRGCAYIAGAFHASTYWDEATAVNARTSQLIGTMAQFLMRQPSRPTDRASSLREVSITPLPQNYREWGERFGVRTPTAYGATEIGSVLHTRHSEAASVGRIRDGYELRIVDENDLELPPGAVGELVVRPTLPWTSCIGYHNRPDQTAMAWRNGWFHSGDALRRDNEGNFFFVDRVDDALRRRGENISTAEVEFFINSHPHVLESAVVGVPSEHMEDEIKAVVILRNAGSISELILLQDLAAKMPYFMVPRYIQFVDELPRTPTTKVQKKVLRASGTVGAWDAEAAGFRPRRD